MSQTPQLIQPSDEHKRSFLDMVADFEAAGEMYPHHQLARQEFTAYLRQVRDDAAGVGLPAGYVPMTAFWLREDDAIVGESRLRHSLSPALEVEGGHIGYAIRPSYRRRGYGTRILELTLVQAQAIALKRVLVTCDTDNVASARVIEKNGGVLAGHTTSNRTGRRISQYWLGI